MLKNTFIGHKRNRSSFSFATRFLCGIIHKFASLKYSNFGLVISDRLHLKMSWQCIDGLGSYPVESNRFFKGSSVILATSIHARHHINYFSKRNTTAIVSYSHLPVLDWDIYGFARTHDKLINTVVKYFFKQNINPIIGRWAIAKFTDIHTWTHPDMLFPIERTDIIFCVLRGLWHGG